MKTIKQIHAGRYGVDNFARFTLGVALFVIVVGSFMRQNAAGAFWIQLDLFLSFIHIPLLDWQRNGSQ